MVTAVALSSAAVFRLVSPHGAAPDATSPCRPSTLVSASSGLGSTRTKHLIGHVITCRTAIVVGRGHSQRIISDAAVMEYNFTHLTV